MNDLALEEERRDPLGVEYLQQDAMALALGERFDLVAAAYLLNYAGDYAALLGMCRAVARHLAPGGRFITVHNNPAHPRERFGESRKYGFTKRATGPLEDGTPVDYVFHLDDGATVEITNYHLDVATHERGLREAGFRQVAWHAPSLAPGAAEGHPPGYWDAFLRHPPVVFLECSR
jgi:SAM-dependent methyltransferase